VPRWERRVVPIEKRRSGHRDTLIVQMETNALTEASAARTRVIQLSR
jgi:hypothetical protein